jgi:MFS transporter, DHA3 family, tetracycline resistance protein
LKRLSPQLVFLILNIGSSFLFGLVFSTNILYYATVIKLSPLELVLVGTALELAILLFEVPTGVVADTISRKISVLIGFALIGLGFLLEGLIPAFLAVLVAQVLWGIGYTFTSGATQAWLSDEIGELEANQLMLRVNVYRFPIRMAIIFSALLLANSSLQIPIMVGGLGFMALSTFLWFAMPETKFKPTPVTRQNALQSMRKTLLEAVQFATKNPSIRLLFLVTIISGAASESFDRLWQLHLIQLGLPKLELEFLSSIQQQLLLFLLLDLCIDLVALPFTLWAKRIDMNSIRAIIQTLLLTSSIVIVCISIFAFAGGFIVATLAYILARACREIQAPLGTAWLNQRLEPSTRATVLSLNGQADAIGQIAGGPIVGFLGNKNLRLALFSGALILALTLPMYARAGKKEAS